MGVWGTLSNIGNAFVGGNASLQKNFNETDRRGAYNSIPISLSNLFRGKVPDMVTACNFLVMFNTDVSYAFQSVSGFSKKIDYEYIVEGGNNDFPRLLRKPKSTPDELTFKRGYVINKASASNLLFGGELGDSRKTQNLEQPNKVGMIFVLNGRGCVQSIFSFITMGLKSWSMGELNAQTGKQLIESFTIMHRGLVNVPIPWVSNSTINAFSGFKDGAKAGFKQLALSPFTSY